MKKLMILGASYSQLPLYKMAKKLGIATVAVSTPGEWPCFDIADECSYTDISDPEAVLKSAREHNIDGITTCCLDAGIRSIGYVCEYMGLKGLSAQAGFLCSDKYYMKESFVKGGVRCAKHICINNREELEAALDQLEFPVILKAVDQMGSRGLFRCETREEAYAHYPDTMAATRRDYCLVEEFIQGQMLGCEAMISNGKFLFCLPNNIENIGHSVPYEKMDILGREVEHQLELAVQALGMDNCPVNCDMMEKDGKIYVIEITGRAGGNCLPEAVSLYYDTDYYEAMVRLALDMNPESLFEKTSPCTANLSHILTSDRSGILKQIHNDNVRTENIVDLSFNVEPGEEIRKYENGRDRIGQVILKGRNLDDCRRNLADVLSKINIEFIS